MGTIYDDKNHPVGGFNSNGTIYNSSGAPIGSIRPDGTVYNNSGAPVGGIRPDGTVYNNSGAPVGHVDDATAGAALLLNLSTDGGSGSASGGGVLNKIASLKQFLTDDNDSVSDDTKVGCGCLAIGAVVIGFIVFAVCRSKGGRIGALIGLGLVVVTTVIGVVSGDGGMVGGDVIGAGLMYIILGGLIGAIIDKVKSRKNNSAKK